MKWIVFVLLFAAWVQAQEVTAFVDVAVVPMDRAGVVEHQMVLVAQGRIQRIGPVRSARMLHAALTVGIGFCYPALRICTCTSSERLSRNYQPQWQTEPREHRREFPLPHLPIMNVKIVRTP